MIIAGKQDEFFIHTKMDGQKEDIQKLPDPPDFPIQSRPFYHNVFATIRDEESLIVTPEQGRRYVSVADAIVRSARKHKTITVEWGEEAE